jgi:hypothetical protein
VCLIYLVRFLVVELTHLSLNPRFDMCVAFTVNYFFSGRRRPVDGETLLVTDFVNLKIKPAQSFEGAHRDRVCICVFIGVSARAYINIYVYIVFKKKARCLVLAVSFAQRGRPELIPLSKKS